MNTEVMVAAEAVTTVGFEEEVEIVDMVVAQLVCVTLTKRVTVHEVIHVDSPMKMATAAVVYVTPGKKVIALEGILAGFPIERIQAEIVVMVAAVVYVMLIKRATVFEEIPVDFLMTMEVVAEEEIDKADVMIG